MSLATYVRAGRVGLRATATDPVAETATIEAIAPNAPSEFERADIVADLTIVRVAAREAFERTARRCIADLAHEVLARELALAPVDLEALVARALVAFAQSEPVAIGVSVADGARIRAPLPIRIDEALACGDLIVFVRDGAFESTFAFRVGDALARASLASTI